MVVAVAAAVTVACSLPTSTPASGTADCAAPSPGNALCGSCGANCYYCAAGTCPADPCTDPACDGTSECSTVAPGHAGWSYCGYCTTSAMCQYCPPDKCSSNPCSTVCDGTGGGGPAGGSGSGSSSGGGGSSSGGGVTTCGQCPGQLECSTIVGNCIVQSCACDYVIDGSDGDSTWYLANGQCYMCQQNGLTTGDCTAAANAAAQAILNCQ